MAIWRNAPASCKISRTGLSWNTAHNSWDNVFGQIFSNPGKTGLFPSRIGFEIDWLKGSSKNNGPRPAARQESGTAGHGQAALFP
jgi:hypothetical protein